MATRRHAVRKTHNLAATTKTLVSDVQALMSAWAGKNHRTLIKQDFYTPLLPCGFILKIMLWTSWGDAHYVGLSGLEVFDASSGLVTISPDAVAAAPASSVADLPPMRKDVRTPDKLVRIQQRTKKLAVLDVSLFAPKKMCACM